ncbi:MAG TPA: tRNA (guanosine(37)-N1)-methyltransferase TrmD [Candidatus Limnocylindria bacterium]|nr:tRNA (guanosine(37)-N1)-methyltransferase TrmD [Candidatus Limnocylindria bacterium]
MAQKKLSIKIITLFPQFVDSFMDAFGIVKKAVKNNLLDIKAVNLRQFGLGERQVVDDRPHGGGVGMVLRPDVLYKALKKTAGKKSHIILLTPQGQKFNQAMAKRLAKMDDLVFVCGRYEGFDERIRQFADEEVSIGDYVLMGGELPALVISEAVMRLRPGILGKLESTENESFSEVTDIHGREYLSLLEYPHYTKPEIWKVGKKSFRIPKVLLTGHHKNILNFRNLESLKRTKKRRPDLIK